MVDATFTIPELTKEQALSYFDKSGLGDIPLADKEFITLVADGVIGALNIACQLYGDGITRHDVALLSEALRLKLTGSRLWVAYKDWAGEDLATLQAAIVSENKEMLDKVDSMF